MTYETQHIICDMLHMTLLIIDQKIQCLLENYYEPPILVGFFGRGEGVFVCVGGGCSGGGEVVVVLVGKWWWICGYVGGVSCGASGGVVWDGSVGDCIIGSGGGG